MASRPIGTVSPRSWRFTPRTPGSTWISFDPTSDPIPDVPAVYVVFLDGVLVYIGETMHLRLRLTAHGFAVRYSNSVETRWGRAMTVLVKAGMSRRFGDWRYREARLIRRLRPRGNQRGMERQA